jgi:hypothetical protein
MKLRCPKCNETCGLFERECPRCGFSLAVGSLVRFYCRRTTSLQCPRCRNGALPIGVKVCPNCGETPTLQDLLAATVEPPRRRLNRFFWNASPGVKRLAQWTYLFLSAATLWMLLGYVEHHNGHRLFESAVLSIVHLAAMGFAAAWFMPRRLLFTISSRATGMAKLSLALNLLAGMLLLQLFIAAWWKRTLLLAGLFIVLWFAAYLMNLYFLPIGGATAQAFMSSSDNQYDPASNQGRTARFD